MSADREALIGLLLGEGLGGDLHGWRCAHPDRYGPCSCVAEVAEALLAEGFRHVPEGTTVTEWGVRKPDGRLWALVPSETRESATSTAEAHGHTVVSRQRTRYADVVTEWEVVDGE